MEHPTSTGSDRTRRGASALLLLALLAPAASAQWNPPAGQWGKSVATDLRVMTWNIEDALCSSVDKVEGANSWCAIARLVAAFKPDVLLLQECGDNTGEGTGSGVDSVANLTTTIDRFLHGGTDPFHGNAPVTSWVRKYAPSYDLPHVFVSVETDGFNRNVILSRYPFADLNGDGKTAISDVPSVLANSAWAPGGDGGIRGFAFAEIDLPDATYAGDLVLGNAHLKSGGSGADHAERVVAAQNVSYVMRYWFNGNGGGVPDPSGRISDSPPATSVLGPSTPIVIGGDWNEDEYTNGQKGPAEWLANALTTGGTGDGTDRDGSDGTIDHVLNAFTGSDNTHSGGDKLDYVAWQDSVVTYRLGTVFISGSTPAGAQPPEIQGFAGGPSSATSIAADHRPVFVDLVYAEQDCNANGVADATDIANGTSTDYNANALPDDCECFAMNYCPTSPNSVGPGAVIGSGGSLSVSANNFVLSATGGPPLKSGIFLFSRGETQVAFGNGWRCVANPLYRMPATQLDLFGQVLYPVDLANLPQGQVIQGGETWRFQLWYRDPDAGGAFVNLTDARRVAFCP